MIEVLDTHLENINTKCDLITINSFQNTWHKQLIIPLSEFLMFDKNPNQIIIFGSQNDQQKNNKIEFKS